MLDIICIIEDVPLAFRLKGVALQATRRDLGTFIRVLQHELLSQFRKNYARLLLLALCELMRCEGLVILLSSTVRFRCRCSSSGQMESMVVLRNLNHANYSFHTRFSLKIRCVIINQKTCFWATAAHMLIHHSMYNTFGRLAIVVTIPFDRKFRKYDDRSLFSAPLCGDFKWEE